MPRRKRAMTSDFRLRCVADSALSELIRAEAKHPPISSAYEGWAVIKEKLGKLQAEIRRQQPDPKRMRIEALQVAAVAMRFVVDVCDTWAQEGESGG